MSGDEDYDVWAYLDQIADRLQPNREEPRPLTGEEWDLLVRCVGDRYWSAFYYARHEGLSYDEIGRRLGISPRTVERRVACALGRLRRASEMIRAGRLSDISGLPLGHRLRLWLGW